MKIQRWTSASVEPSENGGFVAYGDYLVLKTENETLRTVVQSTMALGLITEDQPLLLARATAALGETK